MKNVFDGLISRLDTDEERINNLEDMSIKTLEAERQRKKEQNNPKSVPVTKDVTQA